MASHSDPVAANEEVAAAAVNAEVGAVAEATAQPIVNANDYLLQQQLRLFWAAQLQEIIQIRDFRGHSLPISRIKKIMKSDKEVRMISAESPILLAKACEIFIQELTHRSWLKAQECQRQTLKKIDLFTVCLRRLNSLIFLWTPFLWMSQRKKLLLTCLACWVIYQIVSRTITHQWDLLLQQWHLLLHQ